MDVGGYTERLRAMSDAHPHVIGVTPHDKPCAGFAPVQVPDAWLSADPEKSYSHKCWHGTGTLALAAIEQLGLDADAFWFIESDCAASPQRWAALFAAHDNNPTDGVFVCPTTRTESLWNPWWSHAGTPDWADMHHINCMYRLSRQAVEMYRAVVEEQRECFGEVLIGSAIKRAGGTIGRINLNLRNPHHNNQTIKGQADRVIVNRHLINHPVKSNTYGPIV